MPYEVVVNISIHALRGEGDIINVAHQRWSHHFNPRPPRGGRRRRALRPPAGLSFQSTPSAGRATARMCREPARGRGFQSTPSAGRATMFTTNTTPAPCDFNPRPPRGGRQIDKHVRTVVREFQSTPSAGRATRGMSPPAKPSSHFNPRPPRGGRLGGIHFRELPERFQSTPSAGRATFSMSSGDRSAKTDFNPRPPRGGRRR